MKNLAVVVVGLMLSVMVFIIAFTLTVMLGGLAFIVFATEVNVIDGSLAVASYSSVIALLIYIYLVATGKIRIISDDGDE